MSQPEIVRTNPPPKFPQDEPEFSLVLGGPLYQLYLRTKLARSPLDLLVRRIVVVSLISWLPLLPLSAASGQLTSGVPVPFFRDPEVHIKLLLAIPMLIIAEVLVHQRIRLIVLQFLERNMIARQDLPRFNEFIASAMRLRNSVLIEVALLVVILGAGYWMWRQNLSLTVSSVAVSSWYAVKEGGRLHLTPAGIYYAFVSLSIFRLLLFRWYFRLHIWYRFLWRVRSLPLQLNLYHPDRAGGLGFLAISMIAFSPVFIAQTTALAGVIYTRILYNGEGLAVFKLEIAGAVLFCMVAIALPLTFFSIHLERAGRMARKEFGVLSSHYVDDFRRKWVKGGVDRSGEQLLGTPDMQSLADLANSFNVVNAMNLLPVTNRALVRVLIVLSVPFVPLILTVLPLHEVVMRLFKMIF